MLFNSIQFLIFFPIVVVGFFMLTQRFRWVWLLLASYYFYMCWKPKYALLMLISTVVTFYFGRLIGATELPRLRKAYLTICLLINLGILFAFKYFNFFNQAISQTLTSFNLKWGIPDFSILLPVGISFYTFQALSYTLDVYRRRIEPERHFGIYALYVSFFPQLVAGPIERTETLLPQFYKKFHFDYDRVVSGMILMAWGLFKKMVIADRLSGYVDVVYDDVHAHSPAALWLATLLFSIQIFCDFSGYSDTAIGAARVMGFRLMTNFYSPYFSKSIKEFWRRWHISLSTWFRDYVYIPLGGNKRSTATTLWNLYLTFVISGLWHGANWTYIVWGALHGFYMIFGSLTQRFRDALRRRVFPDETHWACKLYRITITYLLVLLAWVFFRSSSISDALYVVKTICMHGLEIFMPSRIWAGLMEMSMPKYEILIIFYSVCLMESVHLWQRQGDFVRSLRAKPFAYRWSFYLMLLMTITVFGKYGLKQFIYFQF